LLKFGQWSLVSTDSHLTCCCSPIHPTWALKEKANPHKEGSKWPIKNSSDETAQRQYGDKRGMMSNFKWSDLCQTFQKIKVKSVKKAVHMHVWLSNTKSI
jgi:hypothetical protein